MNMSRPIGNSLSTICGRQLLLVFSVAVVSTTVIAATPPIAFNEQTYEEKYGIDRHDPNTTIVYVRKLVAHDNETRPEGSKSNPYHDLQAASDAAGPGGIIYVRPSPSKLGALDGGVVLQEGQMLLGLGPAVTRTPLSSSRAMITNSEGYGVLMTGINTIENLHIPGADDTGIRGFDSSGAVIRSNLIEGHNSGNHGVALGRNDPDKPTGIGLIFASGVANTAIVEGNRVRNALANAMLFRAQSGSVVDFTVKDNIVDNIFGGFHRDGAVTIAYASGASGTVLFEHNIIDNVGGNADSLSVVAYDSGTEIDVLVDHCRILNSNQVGLDVNPGQQGLLSGSRGYGTVRLAVQYTDIIGIKGFGFDVENIPKDPHTDPADPSYVDMDMGGGPYGSAGQNRIVGNGGELIKWTDLNFETNLADSFVQMAGAVADANVVAKYNWWGSPDLIPPMFTFGFEPFPPPAHAIVINIDAFYYFPKFRSTFEAQPQLATDPGRK